MFKFLLGIMISINIIIIFIIIISSFINKNEKIGALLFAALVMIHAWLLVTNHRLP